ncbi:MAG: heavy-metal-associated domain-containing protein [Bacteroidetes bacterium]|nr:heavy-metal-associated domain-containing protein [Bacteroidota bacterium]MBU1719924.1 heavy-metal-associated domain-containing protein [Bacteroidota bacterium]
MRYLYFFLIAIIGFAGVSENKSYAQNVNNELGLEKILLKKITFHAFGLNTTSEIQNAKNALLEKDGILAVYINFSAKTVTVITSLEMDAVTVIRLINKKTAGLEESTISYFTFINVFDTETSSAFPVLKNTGNLEADIFLYNLRKDKWIAANPDQYKEMQSPGPLTDEQQKEKAEKDKDVR